MWPGSSGDWDGDIPLPLDGCLPRLGCGHDENAVSGQVRDDPERVALGRQAVPATEVLHHRVKAPPAGRDSSVECRGRPGVARLLLVLPLNDNRVVRLGSDLSKAAQEPDFSYSNMYEALTNTGLRGLLHSFSSSAHNITSLSRGADSSYPCIPHLAFRNYPKSTFCLSSVCVCPGQVQSMLKHCESVVIMSSSSFYHLMARDNVVFEAYDLGTSNHGRPSHLSHI